jgi:hypothetical protein
MQQYAQAAKGLIANISKDLKELNLRLPDVLAQQLQSAGSDPLGAASSGPSASASSHHHRTQQQQPPSSSSSAAAAAPSGRAASDARVARFKDELLATRVDLKRLRALSFNGIPDRDGLRAITWKLLLGYLPPDPAVWDELLARKRTQYLLFCEELIVDPKKKAAEIEAGGGNPLNVPLGGRRGGGSGSGGGSAATAAAAAGAAADPLDRLGGGGGKAADPLSELGSSSSSRLAADGLSSSSAAADPFFSGSSSPTSQQRQQQKELQRRLQGQEAGDHPLALHNTSVWNTFFKVGRSRRGFSGRLLRSFVHIWGSCKSTPIHQASTDPNRPQPTPTDLDQPKPGLRGDGADRQGRDADAPGHALFQRRI